MKKKIILLFLIVCLSSCKSINFDELKSEFNVLLDNGDFASAHFLYETANQDLRYHYDCSLDTYMLNLKYDAKNTLAKDDAVTTLNAFYVFDYTKESVEEVLAYLDEIELSNQNFIEGLVLYEQRDYSNAYAKLSNVSVNDSNYLSAKAMTDDIKSRSASWKDAKLSNATGKSPYVNSLTYKDDCIYFVHKDESIYSIIKHNYATGTTENFPLFDFVGSYVISSINVVGDYIYFIAGEYIGQGKMHEHPYNIYELKTDGTGLCIVKSGDYFDLISYKDTFYALSYSKGLVMMDNYFFNEQIISDKNIIEMYPCEEGLYYTEKESNTFATDHVLYLYVNDESEVIMADLMQHVYFFDSCTVIYKDTSSHIKEAIYVTDKDFENKLRLASEIDINKFLGVIDNKIIYSAAGKTGTYVDLRQDIYTEINIDTAQEYSFQDTTMTPKFVIQSIFYEKGLMLVTSADGISLTKDVENNLLEYVIDIPTHNPQTLERNMTILKSNAVTDWFSDEEIVVIQDDLWYYSSPTLNVTVDKVFEEYIETNVFIASIRTKDPTMFSLGYYKLTPPGIQNRKKASLIAKVNKAVWASNGDFALEPNNIWTGTVIREGKVYKRGAGDNFLAMYPDGTMKAYYGSEGVTYEDLLADGVQNTLSFGPILVKDSQLSAESQNLKQYLSGNNPRCAWGMIESGHYINIIADGRQPNVNEGMGFYTISSYFLELGCSVAYNLDGGQTAAGVFLGNYVNNHDNDLRWSSHRNMPEIVYFGQSELVPADLDQFRVD